MKLKNKKVSVAKTYFKSRNLLVIEAMLEYNTQGFPDDIVFFTMTKDFGARITQSKQSHSMQLHATDLRNLCEACREIIQCKCEKISFSKMTEKANRQTHLEVTAKNNGESGWTYFVSVSVAGNAIKIGFNKYEIRTFIKKVELAAEVLERELYNEQNRISLEKAHEEAQEGGSHGTT